MAVPNIPDADNAEPAWGGAFKVHIWESLWLHDSYDPPRNTLRGLSHDALFPLFPGLCRQIESGDNPHSLLKFTVMEFRILGVMQFIQTVNEFDVRESAFDWYSFLIRMWRWNGAEGKSSTRLIPAVETLAKMMEKSETSVDVVCWFAMPPVDNAVTADWYPRSLYVLAWLKAFQHNEEYFTQLAIAFGLPKVARSSWTRERILDNLDDLTEHWVARMIRAQAFFQNKMLVQLSQPMEPIPPNYIPDMKINHLFPCAALDCHEMVWWRQFTEHLTQNHADIENNLGWEYCVYCKMEYAQSGIGLDLARYRIDHWCRCMHFRSRLVQVKVSRALTAPNLRRRCYYWFWDAVAKGHVDVTNKKCVTVTFNEDRTVTMVLQG